MYPFRHNPGIIELQLKREALEKSGKILGEQRDLLIRETTNLSRDIDNINGKIKTLTDEIENKSEPFV